MPHPKNEDLRFTYGDYLQWQGDERWELISGEPFMMSPAPSRQHQRVSFQLSRQIGDFLDGGPCELYPAPFDVRLANGAESDSAIESVVQPDLVVICDPEKLDDAGCRGAPDWIVELLSPSTSARDRVHKRNLYEHHGVREYWIVHPTEETLTAYHLDQSSGRFAPAITGPASEMRGPTIFPDLAIDWAPVFGR